MAHCVKEPVTVGLVVPLPVPPQFVPEAEPLMVAEWQSVGDEENVPAKEGEGCAVGVGAAL